MSFISKLPNFNSLTVPQEPQPEPPQPPAVQPAISAGIASTTDAFEAATSLTPTLYNFVGEQTEVLVSNQPVIPPDPVVDASMLFDYVVDDQVPAPPVPPEQMISAESGIATDQGFGQTLEDLTKNAIKKAYDKETSKEFGPDPTTESSSKSKNWGDDVGMPENLSSLGSGGGTTVGGLKGSWNLAEFGKVDEKAEGEWGSAYVKGSTQILGLSGEVYYNLDVDPKKMTFSAGAGAKGSVEILGAHYEAGYNTPNINIGDSKVDFNGKTNADAYVGVKGNVEAEITLGKENNLSLGAGAFDGANASFSQELGVGEMASASGSIKAWAGVGAKAEFEVGFKDGKFSADWGLGLALGAGAEWDLGFEIDFGEVIDTGLDGMREIGLGDAADWIENTGGDGLEFAGDAANWAGGAIVDAGEAIGDAAEGTAGAVGDAAEWTLEAAEEAAKAAAKAAEDAAKAAAAAAEAAANAAAEAAEAAAEAGEDVIEAVGDAVGDVGDAVEEFFDDFW